MAGTKGSTGLANVPDLISRIVLPMGGTEKAGQESAGKDFYRITSSRASFEANASESVSKRLE